MDLSVNHRTQQYLRGVVRFNRFDLAARAALVFMLYWARKCDIDVAERPTPIDMVTNP